MPRVSSKRQITLPVAGCEELDIKPGDEVEIFRYGNHFNIVKREPGSAAAILKGTRVTKGISEGDSLKSNFE